MTTSTTTGKQKLLDVGTWTHGCFTVRVGTDYKTYKEIMAYALKDELYGNSATPALEKGVSQILNSGGGGDSPLPTYFTKRKCRDTSLGGNDAINPLPQFSVDDDISHPHLIDTTTVAGTSVEVSMGQVYSETYDDLQQILYLGFGIPLFSNVGSFWTTATDLDMANLVNKGQGITVEKIGYLLGSAPVRILNIATVPFKFIGAFIDGLQQVKISKYYSFSSQMPMYFRFVNTILVMLATNMNIVASSDSIPSTGSEVSGTKEVELLDEGKSAGGDLSGISTVFRDSGLDMARIMTKRYFYENGQNASLKARFTDEALIEGSNLNNGEGTAGYVAEDSDTSTTPTANGTNSQTSDTPTDSGGRSWAMNWFDNFAAAYKTAIYDGHLFVGFRIDKGMGGTESFTNSVGESQISQTVNEKFNAGREAGFQSMHGDIGNSGLGDILSSAISAARGIFTGLASSFSMDPLAAVATGAARIDIPEVWMSSSYSRSASFTITCLAPYGDFETIFQSEYVPLACILAGTLPRGTGHSSYSAPFVCQAYCRGIFSSPLCIIESLEVTRGADQFGMNAARLPLKLTMHVTLKDLSPVMYMNMGGNSGLLNAIMGSDDNFGEYMMTLAGMGLRDRLAPFRSMRRKMRILMSTLYKNKLSPYMLGMEGGANFTISRMISTIVSGGKNLPSN